MTSQYDSFQISHKYSPGKETIEPILSHCKFLNTTFSALELQVYEKHMDFLSKNS